MPDPVIEYECEDCGYTWGSHFDDECPECGSTAIWDVDEEEVDEDE